ncbi:MAG TPA: hypothetical protein VMG08_06185 [Allosphingosinicella sp.]|nr:hypothetical protein [Allosphingosinicella sp.]
MHDWLVVGLTFAGAPALALSGRWEEVEAGETLPRACGPRPAPRPRAEPEAAAPAPEPVRAPAPAYLRLGRTDEGMDAERRRRRCQGMVRATY